jgi:dTDP-4-amino-4,6-dideoxygalactose transaminase
MKVPFLSFDPLHQPIKEKVFSHFNEIYDSGYFINDRFVRRFEKAFADYCGRKYAIACNSGFSALHLACLGLGLKPGDEVICPTNTFTATALAAYYTGATVRFADIDPDTLNLDISKVPHLVNRRTKAIMAVHMYGNPLDMDALDQLGIPIIEDAAHAHGAEFKGRKAGTLGIFSCFSFFQTKNLGGMTDGGMVLTDDADLAEKLRILHDVGQKKKHEHIMFGYNYRMNEFNAAFLLEKLKMLDTWNEWRRGNASLYDEAFKKHPGIKIQKTLDGAKHVYHLYVVRLKNRDIIQQKLMGDGITTEIQYPVPIHLQKYWQVSCELPIAEQVAREILSLPVFSGIPEEKIKYVIEKVLYNVKD